MVGNPLAVGVAVVASDGLCRRLRGRRRPCFCLDRRVDGGAMMEEQDAMKLFLIATVGLALLFGLLMAGIILIGTNYAIGIMSGL